MNYINYLWSFTEGEKKFKKTSTIIPKFICEEITKTIEEFSQQKSDFIGITVSKSGKML